MTLFHLWNLPGDARGWIGVISLSPLSLSLSLSLPWHVLEADGVANTSQNHKIQEAIVTNTTLVIERESCICAPVWGWLCALRSHQMCEHFCFCSAAKAGGRGKEPAATPLARDAPPLSPPPRRSPHPDPRVRRRSPGCGGVRRRGPACAWRAAAHDAGPQGRALGHGQPPAGHHRQGRRGIPEEVQRARPRTSISTALGRNVADPCCALRRGRRLITSVGVALTAVADSLSQQIKLANQILAEDSHQPMYKVPGPRTVPVCWTPPVHAWPQSRKTPAHLALEVLKDV